MVFPAHILSHPLHCTGHTLADALWTLVPHMASESVVLAPELDGDMEDTRYPLSVYL